MPASRPASASSSFARRSRPAGKELALLTLPRRSGASSRSSILAPVGAKSDRNRGWRRKWERLEIPGLGRLTAASAGPTVKQKIKLAGQAARSIELDSKLANHFHAAARSRPISKRQRVKQHRSHAGDRRARAQDPAGDVGARRRGCTPRRLAGSARTSGRGPATSPLSIIFAIPPASRRIRLALFPRLAILLACLSA